MTCGEIRWMGIVILATAVHAGALAPRAFATGFRCTRVEPHRGASLNWTERSVRWGLSPSVLGAVPADRDRAVDVAIASFDAWSDVPCSDLELVFDGVDGGFEPGFNENGLNDNVVGHRASWPHNPEAIALTFSTFRVASGELIDADVELNGQDFDFVLVENGCSDEVDLGNVLTHEAGHVLGLDHPPATPSNEETTMFGNAPPCERKKRSLADGDIQGLCTIYPRGQPTRQCFEPGTFGFEVVGRDDGFGGGCRGGRRPRGAVVLGAAVGGLWMCRRRMRRNVR